MRSTQQCGTYPTGKPLCWLLPHPPFLLTGISPIFAGIFRQGDLKKICAEWRIKNPNAIALRVTLRRLRYLNLPQVAETNTPFLMDVAGKCLLYDEFRTNHSNKERYHVVHHHRNSNYPVVARLFRFEHKPEFPENRRVDPHSDCSCRHPHHSESVGDHLVPSYKK